jgi:hypothetical protein
MWHRSLLFAAAALAGCMVTSSASAAQPASGQTVNIFGCVSQGVEFGCLIIKNLVTGKTYQINSANPPPDPAKKWLVHLTGKVSSAITFCQQGPPLTDIKWQYVKIHCPAGKAK